MKQLGLGLNLLTKKTRKREFLEQMERVVSSAALIQIVEPHCPEAKTGRPRFAIEVMLRIHYLQQWFGLSDPAMEESLHDVPLYREFAKLDGVTTRLPDESTILRFRHLLEQHDLAADMLRVVNDLLQSNGLMMRTGTAVDATLISAPSSTQNADGERDSEMKQTKKGKNWYFGMKAHTGVDAPSGLVHTVAGTAATVSDLNMAGALPHGDEDVAFGDAGYQGVRQRQEAAGPTWHVAMRRGERRRLNPFIAPHIVAERVEKMKASIRAKVEHPFRVIKQQFSYQKVRYRGLRKNTAQILNFFMLSNIGNSPTGTRLGFADLP
ncbi:IS5 family transposase [Aquabacterium sp. A7-Y]|uniref:IS5 family transposase n=1 Tax=Aquabacterium sp. A7-Y TaxID=1349605 RepID=UPI00223E5430|nr:IS5 family transposase [Aquabacterium sp. A7-Y]MCW7541152.1 IS5 family transposase [Aquabacterium sp. A7-Y]